MELNFGGRLIPRSLVASDASAGDLTGGIRQTGEKGAILAGISMNTTRPPTSTNSVHPAWRETLFLSVFGTVASRSNMTANIEAMKFVTDVLEPIIQEVTPGGGAYLNEADINKPNWQESFYGANYPRLLSIKHKYDPEGLFWGKTAVGSEGWEVVADGRLCTTGI
ncbi:hypothetical protein SLS62_007263 [Diatrype stigma]|uniref:Berberine/berberine-like domain-containing protein n=1 Tax=Diatrype stigma TaxID=117547 RepID=A0AAN9ULL5_9PEZI